MPFPSPGELRDPGIEPEAPVLAYGFFTAAPPGKPLILLRVLQIPLPSNFIPYVGICGAQQCSGGAAETNGNPTNTIIRIWSTHSLCFLASCSPPCGAAVARFLAFVLVAAAITAALPPSLARAMSAHAELDFPWPHRLLFSLLSPPTADGRAGGAWRVRPLPPPQAGRRMRVRIWKPQPLLAQVEEV